jgi:hypothetical protein
VQSRAWALLLALVMLALLPTAWDGSLAREPWEQPDTGYEAGGEGGEESHEQEALVEQRSISVARMAALAPTARLLDRAAVQSHAPTPLRLARPYIPHPSRFSERRLI